MSNIQEKIKEFKDLHRFFKRENPMCNLMFSNVLNWKENDDKFCEQWKILCDIATKDLESNKSNSLFLVQGWIELNFREDFVKAPIYLINIPRTHFYLSPSQINLEIENKIINPFLIYFFTQEHLYRNSWTDDEWCTFLENQIPENRLEEKFIGLFPLWQSWLAKEIHQIEQEPEFSSAIYKVFGEESFVDVSDIEGENILLINNNQQQIFTPSDSKFIEGPPGTGKTESIVNFIGKILQSDKNCLIVSEKRNGLDIIENRLKNLGLNDWTANVANYTTNQLFIEDLKKTWEKTISKNQSKQQLFFLEKTPFKEHLKLVFKASKKFQISKSSIFKILENSMDNLKVNDLKELIPKLENYTISDLENFNNAEWEIWKKLNFSRINERTKSNFLSLLIDSKNIQSTSLPPEMTILKLWQDLLLVQQFNLAVFQKNHNFLVKDRNWFLKNHLKLEKLDLQIEKNQYQHNHWIQIPSDEEIQYLKSLFAKQGWWAKRKQKSTWKKWVRTPEINPTKAIENLEIHLSLLTKKQQLLKEFEFRGINQESEITTVYQMVNSVNKIHWEQFQNFSEAYKKQLLDSRQTIKSWYDISQYLNSTQDMNVKEILSFLNNQNTIISCLKHAEKIDESLLKYLNGKANFHEILVATNNFFKNELEKLIPSYRQFNSKTLNGDVQQFYSIEEKNQISLIHEINKLCQSKIFHFEKLITTPNNQLNDELKKYKTELKKGKSILLKEFGKTKRNKSSSDLIQTPASHWIFALKPIWLATPYQVAKSLPIKREMFDWSVFEEVSRIPVYQAIGSLHRSKETLLFGDSKQMGANGFFKKESLTESLIIQAKFNLPNVYFTEHYRSNNKQIIEFSNFHFYGNKLNVYPAPHPKVKPLEFHFCSNGVYAEKTNEEEAKYLIRLLQKFEDSNESIGVVSFSDSQMDLLKGLFQKIGSSKLKTKEENNKLFFRTLEHLQGEECDHLIIGFGYGKNHEGKFNLQLGPLNRSSELNRFNVLMSRAKQSIHLVSSVKSEDIPYSTNVAITFLRNWISHFENHENLTNTPISNSLNTIEFMDSFSNENDLFVAYKIMQKKGWKFK